ncbi:MAG: amidohydrolase family protein [Acidobacteria bacterium]|nr:amidohydrolase family protein [Acidobacteriota bacterium]
MNTELIISGGTIVDGTGGEPFRGDVAIRNGRITEIGTFPKPEGIPTLDASGLVVAPGFIDIHSHSDFTLFADPRAVSSLSQGTFYAARHASTATLDELRDERGRKRLVGCEAYGGFVEKKGTGLKLQIQLW